MKTRNDRTTPALAVTGTVLEVEIRKLLLSLNYPRCNVSAALSYVEARGTIEGCPVIDREDDAAVNALVARHTGDVESDPSDWPAWTDFDRWAPTEPEPSDTPSPEDRQRSTERVRLDAEDA